MLRALVSDSARAAYGSLLLDLVDDLELLTPTEADAAGTIDAAWVSADLLYEGSAAAFADALLGATGLRWVQTAFAGTDHPLYRPLLERGVAVSSSHENSIAIAEYVLGAVLRAYQQPERWVEAQRAHDWAHHEFKEIYGSTWLVVGLGAIGGAVASRARSFGAHVIGVRRRVSTEFAADELISPDQLATRLGDADVVVLARPGAAAEPALVDKAFLAAMKEGSLLVNVARGSLVDSGALLVALDAGIPALAILDVFDPEPLSPSSPLWEHPRVVLTPHSSAGGLGRHRRNALLFAENLSAFARGLPLRNLITLADLQEGSSAPAQFSAEAQDRSERG